MRNEQGKGGVVVHPIPPLYDARSRVLVLGSIPSPKSREEGFYYAHPRNRFWPVLAHLFGCAVPQGNAERARFALSRGIALWDVLHACEIRGAADTAIRSPVPNDLSEILSHADIHAIFTTGAKAAQLYKKYLLPRTGMEAVALPSTSPANCAQGFEQLCGAYQIILKYLEE